MTLRAALKALKNHDRQAALEAVVARWRKQRAPALGDLAATLEAGLERPSLDAKRAEDRAALWTTALAGSVVEQGAAFADLLTTPMTASVARLEALSALAQKEPDPRMGVAVEQLLRALPRTSDSSKPFWTALFAFALDLADPRLLALGELPATWTVRPTMRAWMEEQLTVTLDALRRKVKKVPALSTADQALVAEIEALLAPTQAVRQVQDSEDDLLAAIYAAPDDDGPRLVYADWLSERGDPRGELIMLQCQPSLDAKQQKRVDGLLKKHARAWLGPLAPVIGKADLAFERGFPATVTVNFKNEMLVREHGSHPAWATVRHLTFAKTATATLEQQRVSQHVEPAMRSLRSIRDVSTPGLEQVVAVAPPALTSLGVILSGARTRELLDAPVLKQLEHLSLSGLDEVTVRWLFETAATRSLRSLSLRWAPAFDLLPWLQAVWDHPTLRTLTFGDVWTGSVTLTRDETGAFSRLRSEHRLGGNGRQLRLLESFIALDSQAFTQIEVARMPGFRWVEGDVEGIEKLVRKQRRLTELVIDGEALRLPAAKGDAWRPPAPVASTALIRADDEHVPHPVIWTENTIVVGDGVDLVTIDPTSWRETARTMLSRPNVTAICSLPGGRIAVASVPSHALTVLGADGEVLGGAPTLGPVHWLAAVAEGREIAAAGSRGFQIFASDSLDALHEIREGHVGQAVSPKGDLGAVGQYAKDTVKLFAIGRKERIKPIKGIEKFCQSLAFSPDGRLLAIGECDVAVQVVSLDDRQEVVRYPVKGAPTLLGFSPDGRWLAWAVGQSLVVRDWQGEAMLELPAGPYAFSPDSQRLAVLHDGALLQIAIAEGATLAELR
ncbi:MAG: TIGR02996 domain-containing protein [Myxococcales bacterium]|nr:TIGR02996 domain-containing protein [Myxococcales bacterium]